MPRTAESGQTWLRRGYFWTSSSRAYTVFSSRLLALWFCQIVIPRPRDLTPRTETNDQECAMSKIGSDSHVASLTAAQQHCQTTSRGPFCTTPFSLDGVRHFQTSSAGAGSCKSTATPGTAHTPHACTHTEREPVDLAAVLTATSTSPALRIVFLLNATRTPALPYLYAPVKVVVG